MSEDREHDPAPEGWTLRDFPDSFAGRAGPFYWRDDGPGVGFFSKLHHGNLGGVVHGGMLMTLADMALFNICWNAIEGFPAVTVSMNAEFLRPAPIGAFIEASGEMTGGGRTIFFARGLVRAGDQNLLAFSGTLKRLSSPGQGAPRSARQS